MTYVWIALLASIGPFFWPFNNGVVFVGALATGKVDPYAAALAIVIGSTTSYLLMYYLARGAREFSPRWQRQMERIPVHRFERWTSPLLYFSGAASIPPQTASALISGSLRISLWKFGTLTFLGRGTRFAIGAYLATILLSFFGEHPYHQKIAEWLSF